MNTTINGIPLKFETNNLLFSPASIDPGTLAMLTAASITASGKILDLGCGYGPVGIYAAKIATPQNIVMSDIDPKALVLAEKNVLLNNVTGVKIIQSDGFKNITDTAFTLILSNPPYHADFSVPKHFIEKGFNRLTVGGKMLMVTKRLDWYKNKLTAIFGGVTIKKSNGYFVFIAEKKQMRYAKT